MSLLPGIRRLFRLAVRQRAVARDVDEELAFHLNAKIEELVGQGIPRSQAERIARREFGDLGLARKELVAIGQRGDARRWRRERWQNLGQDVLFAFRLMRRQPGFAAVVLLTLGIGIGASATMVGITRRALTQSVPFRDPDRLLHLWMTRDEDPLERSEASYPDLVDWQTQSRGFIGIEGYNPTNLTAELGGVPIRIRGTVVTPRFFDLLGVRPALGTGFPPDSTGAGASAVIVTHGFWTRHLGSDPSAAGSSLTLDGAVYTVTAVLPASFQFSPAGDGEVWLLVDYAARRMSERFNHWLRPIARLREGVSREAAEADLALVVRRLAVAYPETNQGRGVMAVSLRDEVVGKVRPILLTLLAAVTVMLLIACANVASLYLARALARRQELAIRVALGASRPRVARQFVVEGLLLALIGGVAGAMLARLGTTLLVRAIPEGIRAGLPTLATGAMDWGTVAVAMGIALIVGVAFGLLPAVAVPFGAPAGVLRGGPRSGGDRSGNRFRDALVVGEIALTLVLLVGAGLLTRSLVTLLRTDAGFAAERVMTMRIALAGPEYERGEAQQRFFETLLQRVGSLPGVESVGAASNLPLNGGGTNTFRAEGAPEPDPARRPDAVVRGVAGAYFDAMGIRIVEGRVFGVSERSGVPAIVVNQTLARQLFGSGSATGRRLRFYAFPDSAWEIVGVVGDVKTGTLDAPVPATVYFSHLQAAENRMSLAVRTVGRPERMTAAIRQEVAALGPELPVYAVSTMKEQIAGSPAVFFRRFPLVLLAALALGALVLAIVGVYGVIAYALTQRTREFGVRLALGAAPGSLVRLLIRRGVFLGLAGTAIGLAVAMLGARLLDAILYGIAPIDPLTLAGTSALMLGVTVAASGLAAWRATRIDPAGAMRAE